MTNKTNHFNRRQLLLGSAAALAVRGVHSASLDLNLNDPWDRLTALAKLRGSVDGSTVMWWMQGTRFGVVDDIVTPMFGMLIGSFQRMRPLEGQGYELNMLELGYFTDLETGEPMDTFRNPYNGNICEVPEQRLGPYPVVMTPTGVQLPNVPPFDNIELTTRIGPAVVQGDDVWLRDDSSVKVDSDHPMMGKHTYNELVTYRGKMSDLNNPDLASVPAEIAFQSVTSWREWLRADDVGGHTTARASGMKVASVDDFPEVYLAAMRERHPDILENYEEILDSPPRAPGGH